MEEETKLDALGNLQGAAAKLVEALLYQPLPIIGDWSKGEKIKDAWAMIRTRTSFFDLV